MNIHESNNILIDVGLVMSGRVNARCAALVAEAYMIVCCCCVGSHERVFPDSLGISTTMLNM